MISLKDIEFASKELLKIGHNEKEVKIGDLSIVLRTLTPIEEADVQKHISADKTEDEITTLEFVDMFRMHSLARAIVEINGVNLRGQDVIETDELLPNGIKVKKEKVEVMFDLLSKFSRVLLSELFQGFVQLNNEAEEEAKKLFPEKVIEDVVEEEAKKGTIGANMVQETSAKLDATPAKIYNVVKKG
jgi:hypothetical protein